MASNILSEEDFKKPIVRKKMVHVSNKSGTKAVIDCGEFGSLITDEPIPHGGTGEGPSPMQVVLGALCGCESVTFNRTAAEFEFDYDGIEFEAAFTIDIRGRQGMRSVVPHFQTVRVQAFVTTNESEERLADVVEETEARCPIFNLFRDASVKVEMLWIRRQP